MALRQPNPTERVEALTTPEGAKGWVDRDGSAQFPAGGHGLDVTPDASPEDVRAEARREEDGNGGEPSNAPTARQCAWSAETSADPDGWSADNPAWGQCAITALVVQLLCGGELLRSTVGGISHYWNRLPDGRDVDLTFGQFGPGAIYDAPPIIRSRDYLTDSPETMRRYSLLLRSLR